ncbi:MAG: DUF1858 domain-containing protein [Defluviitaleaceae bacterium]|nr:DUF1858 domain-containing protein [Defluviitaleaceae bacterium]
MTKIEKEMLIMDALGLDAGLVPVLQKHGLNCFGCPSSRGKSLEMAAASHGVDIDELVADMNAFLQNVSE